MDPASPPQTGSQGITDQDGSERSGHWKRASISATVWWLGVLTAALAAGVGEESESIGYVAGTLMAPFLLAAGLAGFLAKRSSRPWGWVMHLAVTLVAGVAFAVVSTIGEMSGAPSEADPSPSAQAAQPGSEHIDAEELLAELPDGLTYVDAPAELEQQMRREFDRSGASNIIDSVAVRTLESGSVPVGAVMAMVLNDQATSADEQGILRGVEESLGTEGQPVEIGGAPATYLEGGEARMLLHVGEGLVFMVIGQDRDDIEPILAALINEAPSGS